MKKVFVVTPIVAAVITGGTLFALNKEAPMEEPIKSQAVVKTIEKAPETTPEAVEAPEVVETHTLSTQTVEPVTEPAESGIMSLGYIIENTPAAVYSTQGFSELRKVGYTYAAITTAVYNTYQKDSSKFVEGRLSNIASTCVEQFVSAVESAKKADKAFDYRTFTCNL